MKIVITGASGLIGSALVRVLTSEDEGHAHEVLRLVRREEAAPDEISWDPAADRGPDLERLQGLDAAINLAGAGLGDHRWSEEYKKEILESRTSSTRLLAEALASLDAKPTVFLSGSAIGFYGDTGDRFVDEDAPAAEDFAATVAREWEEAAAAASDAGIRTVFLRTGIVLSTKGGALGQVLPLFKAGVGGRLGSGRQYVSWIARPDHIAAMRFLLDAGDISGPVNLTAPNPVTNREYTKAISAAVHRPALFPAPSLALKAVLGEFAGNVLGGQRVLPKRLADAGFEFGYPDVELALRALVDANA